MCKLSLSLPTLSLYYREGRALTCTCIHVGLVNHRCRYNENETLTKFEIMDGAPVRGESIPVRLFLGGFDLTPTYRNIHHKFSLKYYLNLVLVDQDDRRYFKQQYISFRVQLFLPPSLEYKERKKADRQRKVMEEGKQERMATARLGRNICSNR